VNVLQEKNFQNALDTLDDLVRLGPSELRPCISQLEFYLNALKYDDKFELKSKAENYLNDFLINHVERELTTYFLSTENKARDLDLNFKIKELSFEKWSYILDTTPLIIRFLNQFHFEDTLTLEITENRFTLTSKFLAADELLNKRKDIYYLSRKLIEKKVIPTYDVEVNDNGNEILKLVFDFSFDPKMFYCLDFIKEHGFVIKLTNMLENYYSNFNEDICNKRHLCVVVNEDLSVDKYYRIPNKFVDNSKYELLHFPFLFRPVSLIIPVKGFLTTDIGIRQLMDTGSVDQSSRHEVETSTQNVTVHSLDFFSLLVES
jgi:hypothetical protein